MATAAPRINNLRQMRWWLSELRGYSWSLWASGWLMLCLLVACFCAMPFDERLVLGINPWTKPAKFCLSGAIYLWTIAWYLGQLRGLPRLGRLIGVGTAVTMTLEIALIVMQGARGARSHFNMDSGFDGLVFGLMGLLIMVVLLLAVLLQFALLFRLPTGPRAFGWSLPLGMALFLGGSAVGGEMVALSTHSVGVADGGPGLPFLNWSTEGGDLRVSHLLGLHGLQILPLVGWLLARKFRYGRRGTFLLVVFFLAYVLMATGLYLQATAGEPLSPWHGCPTRSDHHRSDGRSRNCLHNPS